MRAFLTIVSLTIREVVRRRLVLLLLILTAVSIALTAWGFSRVEHIARAHAAEIPLIASQLLVLVMFMYSGLLAIGSAFLATSSLAGERESGVALALMARPLRRSDIFFGKWVGLMLLVAAYVTITCALEFFVVVRTTGYGPAHPVMAAAYLTAEGAVMVTAGLLLGSRLASMTGGVLAGALFFLTWLSGVVGGVGSALNNTSLIDVGIVGHLLLPTDGLWRGAMYYLQASQALLLAQVGGDTAKGNPFFVGTPPAISYLLWVVVWWLIAQAIGVFSFARREL